MRAHAVIGANYGDEGKGLITDYLTHREGAEVVVRFNGGAQAGHTVNVQGMRHVFSHFGSGTFEKAGTFLSRFFVCNPILFRKEHDKLTRLTFPSVFVDPNALVSTHYDMLINQAVESFRSADRHGSCGVGFGETIERSASRPMALTVEDLLSPELTAGRLNLIKTYWVPMRLAALGGEKLTNFWKQNYAHVEDSIMRRFDEDIDYFLSHVKVKNMRFLEDKKLVFEGAQGLALDQDSGGFPHVTRSSTGLTNVYRLLDELPKINKLDVSYVTRAYLTRHGAGFLAQELSAPPYSRVIEETNVEHAFQGKFRYAHLDLDAMRDRVMNDLDNVKPYGLEINRSYAVTCLDQVDSYMKCTVDGRAVELPKHELSAKIRQQCGLKVKLESYGPTRKDVFTLD